MPIDKFLYLENIFRNRRTKRDWHSSRSSSVKLIPPPANELKKLFTRKEIREQQNV